MTIILLFVVSYLLGSIPFALIVGKLLFNKDIRTMGSGNLGTTNMIRNFGKKIGLSVFFLDFAKGFVSLLLAHKLLGDINYLTLFGSAAMLGHMFPIFANFKGGKSVATGSSIFIYCYPYLALLLLAIFFMTLFLTGYVSLGSIFISLAAIVYLSVYGLGYDKYVMIAMCILVIYAHRKNIIRIKNGTESVSKMKIFK